LVDRFILMLPQQVFLMQMRSYKKWET
jgi:hypothetical protein